MIGVFHHLGLKARALLILVPERHHLLCERRAREHVAYGAGLVALHVDRLYLIDIAGAAFGDIVQQRHLNDLACVAATFGRSEQERDPRDAKAVLADVRRVAAEELAPGAFELSQRPKLVEQFNRTTHRLRSSLCLAPLSTPDLGPLPRSLAITAESIIARPGTTRRTPACAYAPARLRFGRGRHMLACDTMRHRVSGHLVRPTRSAGSSQGAGAAKQAWESLPRQSF